MMYIMKIFLLQIVNFRRTNDHTTKQIIQKLDEIDANGVYCGISANGGAAKSFRGLSISFNRNGDNQQS